MGGECLADKNLSDVLNLVNRIRLLCPTKTIWLYTGFTWEQCLSHPIRKEIVCKCDIVVDGKYEDELRDITLKWRGSSNQRVIDVKNTLIHKEVVLWTK